MFGYVHMSLGVQRPKTLNAPEAGVTGGCEPPGVGTGNWTLQYVHSNTELSIQPQPGYS